MSTIDCDLCGTTFDPSLHSACASCPMGGHCTLSCCPSCGYTTIDLQRSAPARFIDRLLSSRASKNPPGTVLAVRPGDSVQVEAFGETMSEQHGALLRTYGIDIGRSIRVVQHRPMTVLEVDQTEVALESELAELILVRAVRLI